MKEYPVGTAAPRFAGSKERIDSFDFMRSITAYIIVIYHFAGICCTTPQFADFPLLYNHANGVWGENTSVNIFFMLSGASLLYNHEKIHIRDLRKYYFARFKGIFPMFYMIWLFLFYQRAAERNNLFYNGSPKSMILTFFGMDGYLSYRFTENYYRIGEWFLGALVLLYLVYPLLTWCIGHCQILTTLVLGAGVLALHWNPPVFLIQRERNLLTCMLAFWLGMMFMKHRDIFGRNIFGIVGGIAALVLLLVYIPIDSFLVVQAIPVGLFLGFYTIGKYIMKIEPLAVFFRYTGKISYAIFLLQHVVMSDILHMFDDNGLTLAQEFILLFVTFLVIYIFAGICTYLNKSFLNTRFFQKVQSVIAGS